jgi:poly-gamma-glutamate capsule biosynthesis protein CapA/YwtB (metallophosphatase superfamily)
MRRREALKWIGGVAAFSVASPRWANPLAAVPPQEIEGLWSDRVGQLEAPGPDEFVLTAVGDMIISSPASTRPEPQARQMYRVMREADLAFGNCEEAIASVGYIEPKASAMGWPSILDDFKAAGLDILALANNHYMDLGEEAALQGLEEMSDRGFVVAGAGKDLEGALSPGIATAKGRRVGTLAFWCAAATVDGTSYIERARATDSKPGVAVISGHEVTIPGGSGSSMLLPRASDLATLIDAVERARTQVDFLMVSFHMHWSRADRREVAEGRKIICRAAIDAGADLVIGHGPHVLNAIEIHRGKPILYSLGHFYLQALQNGKSLPQFTQSPSLVRFIESGFNTPEHRMTAVARMLVGESGVRRLDLLPVTVDIQKDGNPFFADSDEREHIMTELETLSAPYGTRIDRHGWFAEVHV